jgi:hypothetical protein
MSKVKPKKAQHPTCWFLMVAKHKDNVLQNALVLFKTKFLPKWAIKYDYDVFQNVCAFFKTKTLPKKN